MVKPEETSQIETPPYANASPSKYFFCEMLTRDIELKDAIMDLVDNCIDGAMRVKNVPPEIEDTTYYSGFYIDIKIEEDLFTIKDNCGGIPYGTAQKYAFRFGKAKEDKEIPNLPTIGLYGIGMKRAIFKMGESAEVITKTSNDYAYKVTIPVDWMLDDNNWNFTMEKISSDTLEENGTLVSINIKKQFLPFSKDHISDTIESVKRTIGQHFGLIIQKGLKITINGEKVNSVNLNFIISLPGKKHKKLEYAPYLYNTVINGVEVSLAVGFYEKDTIPDELFVNQELRERKSSEDAGWTVVCNDRVILYNNKNHLTGWGEQQVPRYHTQFIRIKGIVYFKSSDPSKLPTTTSKRGIDLGSPIYASIKNRMCIGLKKFTDYTNRWKGRLDEEKLKTSKSDSITQRPVKDFMGDKKTIEKNLNITMTKIRGENNAFVFIPDLPVPKDELKTKRISFTSSYDDYETVAYYLFGPSVEIEALDPKIVGEACFNRTRKEALKARES